jgi:hypothetical protein
MRPGHRLRVALRSTALVVLLAATGVTDCQHVTSYALGPESGLTQGCFEPCECPISTLQPLRGTFLLAERLPPGPLFREFVVFMVDWKLARGDETVPITGSGLYRVGGEFAVQQQMELDLRIGDGPAQHFDSGLVVGGGLFPDLDVRVSVNGQFCYDTVIDILASPLPAGS